MQVIADDVSVDSFDVVVVGAGAAGLSAARQLEELDVAVLADAAPVCGGSSGRARGGIAAPVGGDDAPQLHARDTRSAGAGLCAPGAVDALVSNAERTIREMQSLGVEFDRDDSGELELGREAAHSRARIVHAGGDAIGVSLTEALASDVFDGTSEPVLLEGEMLDVCAPEGRVEGVVYRNARGDVRAAAAPAVVLATGGVGWMYGRTTNPPQSTGRGLAAAYRAGAALSDLEFVQFHPTALAVDQSPLPLLTEALRGEGARLVDGAGEPLLADHDHGDLAPRDVVARRVRAERRSGGTVELDVGPVDSLEQRFPEASRVVDDTIGSGARFLPVCTAAHYHMGGIATDLEGETNLEGLWACGEVADTGVHGANRLASNSMLECLVFGRRVGRAVSRAALSRRHLRPETLADRRRTYADRPSEDTSSGVFEGLRRAMWQCVGVERDRDRLYSALRQFRALRRDLPVGSDTRDAALTAELIARSALRREESRGAHYRSDIPESREEWCRHLRIRRLGQLADRRGIDRPAEANWESVPGTVPPGATD